MTGLACRNWVAAVVALCVVGSATMVLADRPERRPNIVVILADDLGYSDLGCYGGEIETPHLDRLAAGGLRFSQFYNNAICIVTRASLLTGLYPRQVDVGELRRCVTLGEVLRAAGYRTLMSGKWHQAGRPDQRGFDRYYGLLSGCSNHFNPGRKRPDEAFPGKKFPGDDPSFFVDGRVVQPFTPPRSFYSTDVFTDRAIDYVKEWHEEPDRPFFLFLSYTVPHYPLHAPAADIARYRGRYLAGWDRLRERRLQQMQSLGLVDPAWSLSRRSPHAPAWESITDKQHWDLKMAVYAAMVDRMDRNIGRLIKTLRALDAWENTLVLFLSDNGPSNENRTSTPDIPPGRVDSYWTVDLPWANLSNTPFRYFKRWHHEGGISTPLIASWPRVIRQHGKIIREVGHVIDIMATCVDLAGADYPGRAGVAPMEGVSLRPVFEGRSLKRNRPLFWNHRGTWRAVRQGRWKLVSPDQTVQYNPWRLNRKGRRVQPAPADLDSLWELYDLKLDRTERHNLSKKFPDRVTRMANMYKAWERRTSRPRKRSGE